MADEKLTQLTSLAGAQVPTDLMYIVDLSEVLPADQSKSTTVADLFNYYNRNTTDSSFQMEGIPAPGLSGAGDGKIYFDSTSNTFKVSQNGGAFFDLGNIAGSFTSGQVAYANGTNTLTGNAGLTFTPNALTLGTAASPGGFRLVSLTGFYWNLSTQNVAANKTLYLPDSVTPTTGNLLFISNSAAQLTSDWTTGLTWSNSSKQITVTASANAQIGLGVQNTSSGTAAECVVGFTANGGAISLLSLTGTGFSTSGLYKANQLYWRGTTGITEMLFALDDASTAFKFGVNNAVAASINATSTEGLVLGIASSLTGRVKLFNSAGATYTQISAGNAAANLNYILPATSPTAGQVLTAAAPSGGDVVLSWGAGGGGGAPVDATYLTLSLNGTLTNERVFTLADTTLNETDGGAGGNYSIGVNQANTFAWTAAHTHAVAIGAGSATSTSPSPFITASPTTAPGAGNYKASPSIILNGQANSGAGAFNARYRLYTLVNDNAGAATLDFQFNNSNVDATFRSILQLTQGGATGLAVTGAAAGSGVTLTPVSSGTDESMVLVPKNGGGVNLSHSGSVNTTNPLLLVSPLLDAQTNTTYYGSRVNATIRPGAANTATVAINSLTGAVDVSNPPAQLIGSQASLNHTATGTINTVRSFYSNPGVYNAASAVGALYHFSAGDVYTNSLGTVVTQYGFHVPSPFGSATNNWAFYNASNAPSYLGGNLGINKTSLAAQIDLLSSAQDKFPFRAAHIANASIELGLFVDSVGRKRFSVGTPDSNAQTLGLVGGQGESATTGTISENVTLNTGGATTDTTIDLPANAIITAVTARVTATIAGAGVTSLSLGDSSNSTRFSSAGVGLAISQTLTVLCNSVQTAAAKLRITANGGTPSSGAVLITISYTQAYPALGSLDNTSTGLPFSNSRIVFDGDSNTAGAGTIGGQNYPTQAIAILGGANPNNNFGVNGKTIVTMLANAPSQIDPLYDAAHGRDTVICWGGSNDIAFATGAAVTTYNNIVAYCNARRAVGWRTYVTTLLPRSDVGVQPNYEVDRQTINTSIRANWATFADGLIDPAANPLIGDAGDETNTAYYASDRVHLNNAGSAIEANLAIAAIAPSNTNTTALQNERLQGNSAYLTSPSGGFTLTVPLINSTNPALYIDQYLNAQTNTTYYGARVNTTVRPGAANTAAVVVGNFRATVDVSNPPAQLIGNQATLDHTASGTISAVRSFYSAPGVYGASSAASNLYHFAAADVYTNSVGTVVNQYGFYVPAMTAAANNWAFYNAGAAASYLGGNLGIGTTTFGANAAKILAIAGSTVPTTYPADSVQLAASDYAAGDARLRVYSENGAQPVVIGGNAVLCGRQVVAKTADYTIQYADSNTVFTNTGASGAVIFTLCPTGVIENYTLQFFRVANQSFTIQCPPGVVIRVGASATSAGGTVTLDAVGSGLWIIQVDSSVWYGYTVGAATFA